MGWLARTVGAGTTGLRRILSRAGTAAGSISPPAEPPTAEPVDIVEDTLPPGLTPIVMGPIHLRHAILSEVAEEQRRLSTSGRQLGFHALAPGLRNGTAPTSFILRAETGWDTLTIDPEGTIDPIGCNFLEQVEIFGSGYPFCDGVFLLEWSHVSQVAQQWLRNVDWQDNPLVIGPLRRRRISEPVLFVFGPGFPIYGHWLIDYLPKVAIAKAVLKDAFPAYRIPLPADTPDFVFDTIVEMCGVDRAQFLTFDRLKESLFCESACVPTVAYSGEYRFHPFFAEFYKSHVQPSPAPPHRRLCLSRRNYEAGTRSLWRVLDQRALFEEMAVARGYEIVCPEDLSIAEQIALFDSAACIVGEYGSALHNSIFMRPGTTVGALILRNAIQLTLGYLNRQQCVFMHVFEDRTDERGAVNTAVPREALEQFFDRLAAVSVGSFRSGVEDEAAGV